MKDERFFRGIEEFNRHAYFEAHDLLEDLWHEYRENDRLFLQGLIQIAVGCYHLENRNHSGARSQFGKGMEKLGPFTPRHQGVHVGELLEGVRRCLEFVEEAEKEKSATLNESLLPTIQYTSTTAA